MGDFVSDKLTEWGLSQLIDRFKDEEIDKESLYSLGEKEINEIIPKVGPRMKFKKNLEKLKQEDTAAASSQVLPSTSGTEKRRSDHQPEASELPSPKRQRNSAMGTAQEDCILSKVNKIMTSVIYRLDAQDETKLNAFLKDKINDLKTDKKKLVGVFGKTGAGKSSLINAVIGEKNLLPYGDVGACTTVMIKVEGNMHNTYEANIEFITKEEWEYELWPYYELSGQNSDQESGDFCEDINEKLSAFYGEQSKPETRDQAMKERHFKTIPEFLNPGRKVLTFKSAAELSEALVKFTRNDTTAGTKQYWPLVKCVTIKVPNNDFLKHVTLVDLPGNGDCNKSRNEMWKGLVGSCSTVWIVTEINRAEVEIEAWEILNSSASLMGNGGECQHIHFICTKSDHINKANEIGKDEVRTRILERNTRAKEAVMKVFRRKHKLKNHFSENVLQVFTVSSEEFHQKKHLCKKDTEIPKLQEFLQNLNDHHSETFNYVYGAYGILSLMQASHAEVSGKRADVYRDLDEKLKDELDKVRKPIEEACKAFETCLSEGVTTSEETCEDIVDNFLNRKKDGRGFHRTLKSIVANNGAYKPPKKTELNLNVKLCKHMFASIDEQFKKTFPNEGKDGPFNDVVANFSLDTKSLAAKYEDVQLQLTFLNTEEEKLKANVISLIREQKKTIYGCLPKTIEESMKECYQEAAKFKGPNTLKNMKDIIEGHVCSSKTIMFKHTKDVMMGRLNELEESILKTLEENLRNSMELSLKTDDDSIPDVQRAYVTVEKYYKDLSKDKLG